MESRETAHSSTELIEEGGYTPDRVATDLMSTIKDIEEAIEDSGKAINEVKGRGFIKKAFSSSSKDLVSISQSQNKINEMMLSMIQEVITLNAMSYSYLASVQSEFHRKVKEGWVDNEGRFQELSESGEAFASTASDIFSKIIEGSRSTRDQIENNEEKIDLNATQIEKLHRYLDEKKDLDNQQSQEIESLKKALRDKSILVEKQSDQIKGLSERLKEKAERVELQASQLDELEQVLKKQEETDREHADRHDELVEKLQKRAEQAVSRDNSIDALNRMTSELAQRVEDVQGRYKRLSIAMVAVCLVGLTMAVGLGLEIRGVL